MRCFGLSSRCVIRTIKPLANRTINRAGNRTLSRSIHPSSNPSSNPSTNRTINQAIKRFYHSSKSLSHGDHHAPLPPRRSARRTYNEREQEILATLSRIPVPSNDQSNNQSEGDVVYAGHVLNVSVIDGDVSIILALNDHYRTIRRLVQAALDPAQFPWMKSVRVSMDDGQSNTQSTDQSVNPALNQSSTDSVPLSLRSVKHIIAVSSCKGGVGKSTVTVNLAYSISQSINPATNQPFKVGILDADIFGPSLPTLVGRGAFAGVGCQSIDGMIEPMIYEGVKSMSYGYFASKQSGGSILRGPLASMAIKDLITRTNWGSLDYLIIDFPPGTGDIALTLTQSVSLDAAIVITTPNVLAHVDVMKGIEMFRAVHVPVTALVENLAYYVCDNCDTKHRLFGEGHIDAVLQQHQSINRDHVYRVPIVESINQASERGDPFVLTSKRSNPREQEVIDVYSQMANDVIKQSINQPSYHLSTKYDAEQSQLIVNVGETTLSIKPYVLRTRCRCAGCVDEISGKKRVRTINQSVKPIGLRVRGRYAVAVHWSDGHATSLYTIDQLKEAAQESNSQSINQST